MDILSKSDRRRVMSRIRGSGVKAEVAIRKKLYAEGFRYRINDNSLPGKPDLVLPRFRAVVFINGCFWHYHRCHLSKLPADNREFWAQKLAGNVENDRCKISALRQAGWRVAQVWECAFRRANQDLFLDVVVRKLTMWIKSDSLELELDGREEEAD